MKSLLRIIRRYSISVAGIVVAILISNVAASALFAYLLSKQITYDTNPRGIMEDVGEELKEKENDWQLSKEGERLLESSSFLWAMALDAQGRTVWEWRLPADFARSYTLQEVASFSRWYLNDYPVSVWRSGELLLVFGNNPQQKFRYSVVMSRVFVEHLPQLLAMLLAVNLVLILLFILCFGFRFYRSLRPVAQGIEQVSQGKPLKLQEKGPTGELAAQLNRTSQILEEQREKLQKRDRARTEWISGVSHDIRTPLSLIVGNASRLAESERLGEAERELAGSIERQSMIISRLIQDLNLTSKLAYESQPLRRELCSPALLLRECAADLYNGGLDARYEITVEVSEAAEQRRVYADAGLLARALRNLIGNSIRHNPDGCAVEAVLYTCGNRTCCLIRDSGAGIPERIVREIGGTEDAERSLEKEETNGAGACDSAPHIMGLRLTAQIARAHGGGLEFVRRPGGTYDAKLYF